MVNLSTSIQRFLKQHIADFTQKKFLIAFSGGKDSSALVHAFHQSGLSFAVAHVNFMLRGDESTRDELFVKFIAEKYGIQLFLRRCDTRSFADNEKLSIQEAARQLRYDFFDALCDAHQYDFIVTAHHADDVIETFFINLFRGSGVLGLSSIKAVNGRRIRPIINVYRKDIEDYIKRHQIEYVEDSSNPEEKYLRNRIRHRLIPTMESIREGASKKTALSISLLQTQNEALQLLLSEKTKSICVKEGDTTVYDFSSIESPALQQSILYHVLSPFSANKSEIIQISNNLEHSEEHHYLINNIRVHTKSNRLTILSVKEDAPNEEMYELQHWEDAAHLPFSFQVSYIKGPMEFKGSPNEAWLDANLISFPLTIRKFRQGDRFRPSGMKGSMKVSDYFINRKFTMAEKKNCWLLFHHDEVVWILGERVGQNFVANNQTKEILVIKYAPFSLSL